MVLLRVSRPPLHDEGVQIAELDQVECDQDDGTHRHEDRQESDEVASCKGKTEVSILCLVNYRCVCRLYNGRNVSGKLRQWGSFVTRHKRLVGP